MEQRIPVCDLSSKTTKMYLKVVKCTLSFKLQNVCV